MRSSALFSSLLVLLLALLTPIATGCRPKARTELFDQSSAADHAARLERWLAKHPDDHAARLELAHVYWLHLAAPQPATAHLDVLTQLDSPPPLARFSRAVLAQSHLDLDRAWREHAALLREAPGQAKRRDRELALALTPASARLLEAIDGLRPGDTEQFVELFEQLDRSAYPGATIEQLLSTRANIARRLEQDYRSLYAEQGCVQDWVIGELEGYRGSLELARREVDRSFRPDATGATTTPLSCAFRVWNPEPNSGIRRLRSTVEVPSGQSVMRLSISTQYDARVYVDDQLIWAKDRIDRYPIESPTFALPVGPGRHRIEVRTAIPTERAWLLVRATDLHGAPLSVRADADQKGDFLLWKNQDGAPPKESGAEELLEVQPWATGYAGLRGPVYAPLRSFLALDEALSDGDSDRAELLATELQVEGESFPEGHLLLADFEHRDPTRGKTSSAARQQASLERSLELDPSLGRAQLSLLSLRLERGDVAEVVEALEAIPADSFAPTGELLLALLRFEAYRARGSDYQAEQALAKAAAIHPNNCDVLMARRELIRERAQVAAEDVLIEQLATCPGSLGLRASLAMQRGRHDAARELWQAQLERIPDDLEAMEALVEIAIAGGRYDEAIEWHQRMLELAPYRALSHVELADIYAHQ